MIEFCYECETSGTNCPAHRVPPATQMCACGQPTQGHNDHYCNPPIASPYDVERRNYPKTCAEAGDFCVDQCTLRSADRSILDPDCFRGPRGVERLAAWRRSREKINDAREASIAAGPQERELPTPIQLPQCRFCGGPGHAYGERCLRDLSGRSFNLQSPSASIAMARHTLDEFKSRHFAFPSQPLTVTQAQQLVHAIDIALSAVHEALADLYTGRL